MRARRISPLVGKGNGKQAFVSGFLEGGGIVFQVVDHAFFEGIGHLALNILLEAAHDESLLVVVFAGIVLQIADSGGDLTY